ncbi:unnamed protein product [Rotaria sp. Silwood1]|nr:unnamed protein product [Rotaria sp. Silwood1]
MSKSKRTRVYSPSPSSRHRSPSESSTCTQSCKRLRRTSISPPPQATSTKLAQADGLYKSPTKLRLEQASLRDSSTIEYQQIAWENLKKNINRLINKVNRSNIPLITKELFQYNIIRGRGLLAHRIIEEQIASPFYTSVYAALVAVINSKIPQIGELIVKRLISSFHQSYQQNDKTNCLKTTRFIIHLIHQNVLLDTLPIEILVYLLKNPSDDSVELAIEVIKECGQKISEFCPRMLDSFFSKLRNLLHESSLHERTRNMIEALFAIRMNQFKADRLIPSDLDLVDEQRSQRIGLIDPCDPESMLDIFQYDEQYDENENKYKQIRKTILGESTGDEDESSSSSSNSDDENQQSIIDATVANLGTFFRIMFLTLRLNKGAEKCARKLLQKNTRPGAEIGVCRIILDLCAKKRRYRPFFGFLAQRLCLLKTEYVGCFEKAFQNQYEIAHHLESVKLKNLSNFFGYMLATNSISWSVLRCIRLTEDNTTSSSHAFIKNLFLKLVKFLGLSKLINRFTDPTLTEYFQDLFPRDDPKNTQFSIKFFEAIGLDGLTNGLREFLRRNPTPTPPILSALSIKEKEDEDDHENQGHIEALRRELQMQQQNKQDKKDKKNSHRMVQLK